MVASFGKMALQGYAKAKIIATLKHFPGHGDVEVDSHTDLPILHKSMSELEKVELLPFAELESSADAIMTAHMLVPVLDPEHCSTLSEKTLSYLRNKLKFKGVIITDSLVMEGVLKQCKSVDEAAIQALNAGCDILLLGGKQLIGTNTNYELTTSDIQRIHGAIVSAVKSGRVQEKRVDEAVEKILSLKNRYLMNATSWPTTLKEDHQALAHKIASLALQTIRKEPTPIPSLKEKKVSLFAPQLLRESIEQTSLLKIGKSTDATFSSGLEPSKEEMEAAKAQAESADVLLVCSYNAWKNPAQEKLIQSLLSLGKPVILLCVRDPLDASLFPKANLMFNTFSPTSVSIQAVCDQLTH
jgi:beta-N-acetylhexosaminidase